MTASAIAREWKFDAPVIALTVNRNGDYVAAALGDGSLRLFHAYPDFLQPPREIPLHNGISLSLQADADAHAFLSGGDDGKVFIIDPALGAPSLLAEHKGQWIDHVASAPDDFRAYSAGKRPCICSMPKETRSFSWRPAALAGWLFRPKANAWPSPITTA